MSPFPEESIQTLVIFPDFADKRHLSLEMCNVCRLQHCTARGLGQAGRYYNDNCQENSIVSTEHQRLKNEFPLSAHFGTFKVQS